MTMEEDLMGKMFDVEIYETGNNSVSQRPKHIAETCHFTGKHYMKGRRIVDGKVVNPALAPTLPKGQVSGELTKVFLIFICTLRSTLNTIFDFRYLQMISQPVRRYTTVQS